MRFFFLIKFCFDGIQNRKALHDKSVTAFFNSNYCRFVKVCLCMHILECSMCFVCYFNLVVSLVC